VLRHPDRQLVRKQQFQTYSRTRMEQNTTPRTEKDETQRDSLFPLSLDTDTDNLLRLLNIKFIAEKTKLPLHS